jgi:hypothetical protein
MKTKSLIILCTIIIGMGNITVSRAGEDKSVEVIADILLVRPGCFIATIFGSAAFVIALPFAAASHTIRQTADTLVMGPAQATFTRPVGEFSTLD